MFVLVVCYSMFSKLTMEVVLSVAFGQSLDVQNGNGGDLYQLALKVMTVFDSDASTTTNMVQFFLSECTILCICTWYVWN